MVWIALGTVALLVIVGVLFMARRKRKPKNYAGADVYRALMANPGSAPILRDPRLEPLRQNLRLKHLHQEDKVDAALAFERDRNPSGTPDDWHKAAIARWERDNQ